MAASSVQDVKLAKTTERRFEISKTTGFTNTTLPIGGVVTLTRAPAKVVGACSATGLKLKALASKGKCTISFAKWSDTNHNYLAYAKSITMISGTQAFGSSVEAAGTYGYPGYFRLARTTNVITNWGQRGTFTTNANCQVVVEGDGSTTAYSLSNEPCKVTLSVPKRFGLKALTRTWTLNFNG
jgi:hypothetical protein